MAGPPDVVVCTPGCIPKCLSAGFLQSKSLSDSLKILILDEVRLRYFFLLYISYMVETDMVTLLVEWCWLPLKLLYLLT